MRPRFPLFLFLLAAPLFAQQPHVETVEVRLIEVDAIVTDKAGNPVTGLGPDDFEVFENRRRQTITNFTEYRDTQTALPAAAPVETRPVSRPEPRSIVILVDPLSKVLGTRRTELFEDLRSLIERTMREGDRAQVFAWNDMAGARALTPMTSARDEIERSLDAVARMVKPEIPGVPVEEMAAWERAVASAAPGGGAALPVDADARVRSIAEQAAEQDRAVMRRKTAAMQRILTSLGQPGRKTILVYVSDFFPMIAGKRYLLEAGGEADNPLIADDPLFYTGRMLEAVVRAANAIGARFYALRPDVNQDPFKGSLDQNLQSNEFAALEMAAEETGGLLGTGSGGVERAIEQIVKDTGSYYSMAYRAPTDGRDRERRIEVRTRNRDLVVRTRSTIVDRSDRTRARDLLVARLFERGPVGGIEFDVAVGEARAVRGNSRNVLIPVTLTIPVGQLQFEAAGDARKAKFSVLAVAGGNIGETSQIREESREVSAPPGMQPEGTVTYRFELLAGRKPTAVSLGVFDEKSGLVGTRTITLQQGQATVETPSDDSGADAAWREALARAEREGKVIVAFSRPRRCKPCAKFESDTMTHPTIQRRLSRVVFVTKAAQEPGIALFDRAGVQRVTWSGVPDTTTFGAVLDAIIAVAPNFDRGEVEAAVGLARLGRIADARAALARAAEDENPETRQMAIVAGAMLDANEGNSDMALAELDKVITMAVTPQVADEAWAAIETIRAKGAAPSDQKATGPIRIIPLDRAVVSGRQTIRTNATSAAIDQVVFSVDGREVQRVQRPPFAATIDLGETPQRRTIHAVALDDEGNEVGRDEIAVNDAGETFALRLLEPRDGTVSGSVRVRMSLRAPPAQPLRRVVVSWNDAERAVLTAAPWEAGVNIPQGQLGVLRVVAELENGRTAEDAVLLNASGGVEHADVRLLELPITVTGRGAGEIEPDDVVVLESGRRRRVEALSSGADTPMTIGLLIDSSASMQNVLPDVQEAAIRFLQTVMTDRDRAFLVTFDTRARLVQPPTADRALLARHIMSIRPDGLTALNDAIALGLLQFQGVKGRRALVVFSDGVDRTSRYETDEIADLARRVNVPIHLIASRPATIQRIVRPQLPGPMDREVLVPNAAQVGNTWANVYRAMRRVTAGSGGSLQLLRKLEDLPVVYAEIEKALRAQMLAFVRTDPGTRENEWRSIKVDVTGRNVDVRAPEGYYAEW